MYSLRDVLKNCNFVLDIFAIKTIYIASKNCNSVLDIFAIKTIYIASKKL